MAKIIERVAKIIEIEGVSVNFMENLIGASKGVLGKAIAKNTDIQSKWISMIAEKYPQYSTDWLLTGNGEMFRSTTSKDNTIAIAHPVKQGGIPLIPVNAMAGFVTGDSASILEYECDHYVVPMFKEADFLIPVKGSSMIPKYNSGDLVACKRLPLSDIFFQWNHVYVLDTEQGALIKRICRADDNEHILCVSDNAKYEPFKLHLNQIHAIALVVGVIRLE